MFFDYQLGIIDRGVIKMSVQTMESMVRWVDSNVMENPTLQSMANYVGYSQFYCSAKFREYTGMSYKSYLAKCKLNMARKLLATTNTKIIDIAYSCSYLSSESFTRAFVKAFSCTPTEYRRLNRLYSGDVQ